MQRDALAELGKLDTQLEGSQLFSDFGFHFPFAHVRRTYLYLQRGWGWPEGGGWADQDARLLDDLDTYYTIYLPIFKTAENGIDAGDDYEVQVTTAERRRLGRDDL